MHPMLKTNYELNLNDMLKVPKHVPFSGRHNWHMDMPLCIK